MLTDNPDNRGLSPQASSFGNLFVETQKFPYNTAHNKSKVLACSQTCGTKSADIVDE